MDILGLTTTDQIRAVLTVSESDLPEEVLVEYAMEDDLAADLEEWVADWESITQAAPKRLLRLYSKYFCAATIAGVAQVFVLKKDSDGNNEGQRSEGDFKELAEGLRAKALRHKTALQTQMNSPSGPRSYSLVGRVIPARDVILEGRADASE